MRKFMVIFYIAIFIIGIMIGRSIDFKTGQDTAITVNFYDENGKLIKSSQSFAIVNNVENIKFINFEIHIKNVGDRALSFRIADAKPQAFKDSITADSFSLDPGSSKTISTELINVDNLPKGKNEFYVAIEGTANYAGKQVKVLKRASVILNIQPDPEIGFEVDISNPVGEQEVGVEC